MTPTPDPQRLEVDREDLMREATALGQRAEFRRPDAAETVIAGYRSDGSLSIYFGPDPCYHFNPDLRLRRAYVEGDLYRTQGTTLARMQRIRTHDAVVLQRHDLSPEECESFLDQADERLRTFAESLTSATADCVQCVPEDSDIITRLTAHLSHIVTLPLALAPAIRGKR